MVVFAGEEEFCRRAHPDRHPAPAPAPQAGSQAGSLARPGRRELTQLLEGVGGQLQHLYTRASYPGQAHSLPAVSMLGFADIAVFF